MTPRRPEPSEGERGHALIAVLVLVVAVALAGASALQRSSALARDNLRERGWLRALHAAEGGVARARHALRSEPYFAGDELEIGRCTVAVKVRRTGDGQWEITSRASCPIRTGQSVSAGVSAGHGARTWHRVLR